MAPPHSAFISYIPGGNACRRLRLFPSLPLAHRQGAHKRKDDLAASIRMMQILILRSNPDIHGGKDQQARLTEDLKSSSRVAYPPFPATSPQVTYPRSVHDLT